MVTILEIQSEMREKNLNEMRHSETKPVETRRRKASAVWYRHNSSNHTM